MILTKSNPIVITDISLKHEMLSRIKQIVLPTAAMIISY